MKAVILLAGIGTRLHPLTLTKPKSLLPIGNSTVLEHMITKLQKHGINSFVIVCGHMQDTFREYIKKKFPGLDVVFVLNKKYRTTNTGYSLLSTKDHLSGGSFIKLDGDVIFEEDIISKLVSCSDDASYVCIDKTSIDEEVIKVSCDGNGHIDRIGNKLDVRSAIGESIGIERISKQVAPALFKALELMMETSNNHQNYYEVAYDQIIRDDAKFKTVDITGLQWVEMDNLKDYKLAQAYFS